MTLVPRITERLDHTAAPTFGAAGVCRGLASREPVSRGYVVYEVGYVPGGGSQGLGWLGALVAGLGVVDR